jgi:hypothetical protein
VAINHQELAELVGTAALFLDAICTEISSEVFADGFESGTTGLGSEMTRPPK